MPELRSLSRWPTTQCYHLGGVFVAPASLHGRGELLGRGSGKCIVEAETEKHECSSLREQKFEANMGNVLRSPILSNSICVFHILGRRFV